PRLDTELVPGTRSAARPHPGGGDLVPAAVATYPLRSAPAGLAAGRTVEPGGDHLATARGRRPAHVAARPHRGGALLVRGGRADLGGGTRRGRWGRAGRDRPVPCRGRACRCLLRLVRHRRVP